MEIDWTKLSSYDFELPKELIAQSAVEPRHSSKLMVVGRRTGTITHAYFHQLSSFLDPGDFVVLNNTRVMHSRLLGKRLLNQGTVVGGEVEFLVLGLPKDGLYEGLIRSGAKVKEGFQFKIEKGGKRVVGTVIVPPSQHPNGIAIATFDKDPLEAQVGVVPLPPYIDSALAPSERHQERYQTTFNSVEGSSAAPTAGLHFTNEVFQSLSDKKIDHGFLTLHVGLGTFRPVKVENLNEHTMHPESYFVGKQLANSITETKAKGGRIVAVGTTSVRSLETCWIKHKKITEDQGQSSLFIRPGAFDFQCVDSILTNFHLPMSTLLMLISAFATPELIKEAYRIAIEQRYRFYSFGDAMLIL